MPLWSMTVGKLRAQPSTNRWQRWVLGSITLMLFYMCCYVYVSVLQSPCVST